MKLLAGGILVFTFCSTPLPAADEATVWVGTTTPRNGLSKGIYRLTLNSDTGRLSRAELAAEIGSPGFLALSADGSRLYSTGSVEGKPSVAAYAVQDGKLELLNAQPIGDGGAAHVSVNAATRLVLTAQYGGGSVAVFPLNDDGGIKPRSQLFKHKGGSRVVGRRQDAPHAHWTGFGPDNRFAFVPDLGLDAVLIYRLDATTNNIFPHGRGVVPPGGGPRHMKFHPNGRFAFVLNELALSITTFAWDEEVGTLLPLATVPTLTEEQKAKESFNSAAEIRVHHSGRFVYSSNRGHDSISVFRCNADSGRLSLIEVEPVRGSWPRNFNIDPTGKWLLAAGRDSNTLAVFSIDQDSGELKYIRSTAFVPTPICVEFGP